MNFMQEEKGYCNNEEEDDEEVMIRETNNFPFPYSSSSSKYKDIAPPHLHPTTQNMWKLGISSDSHTTQQSPINFDKKLDLMDLSLGNNSDNEPNIISGGGRGGGGDSSTNTRSIEKEHMFDKVVTPSDVGKLNRLVIPKQHAEKYFPLDSSSNEKGLLLNFEDRNGKSWRFRYSYWNSSQSYVMTKGWSRFVKEKKLDAGDIVSFQRGAGEKDRLYIDWRRRPNAPDPGFQFQNHQFNFPNSLRWGRLYSYPQPMCLPRNYEPLHRLNYSIYPYDHNHYHQQQQHQFLQQQHQQQTVKYGDVSQYYLRSSTSSSHQIGGVQGREGGMVIDSVPVVDGNKSAGKRLRLFGVNMDCQDESSSNPSPHLSPSFLQSRLSATSSQADQHSKKGKSSLSIDLGL